MTSPTADHAELPGPIRTYLVAHPARDTAAALQAFSDDAVVVDQGRTFRGTDEVRAFVQDAGADVTYTTEILGSECLDDEHWAIRIRLEGDFPGGVADLTYRFTTDGDVITELVIAG